MNHKEPEILRFRFVSDQLQDLKRRNLQKRAQAKREAGEKKMEAAIRKAWLSVNTEVIYG